MSAKTTAWTWENSPYSGTKLVVHLAMADVVNSDYDFDFWMTNSRLAAKCNSSRETVNRALAQMVEDGYLEVIEESRNGSTVRYRFLMPEPVTDGHRGVTNDHRGCDDPSQGGVTNDHTGVTDDHTGCDERSHRTKENSSRTQEGTKEEPAALVERSPDAGKPTAPKSGKPTTETPARLLAREILNEWWERQDPRPAQNYMGCVKIVEGFIKKGWPQDAIEYMLENAPVISYGAMTLTWNTRPGAKQDRERDRVMDISRKFLEDNGVTGDELQRQLEESTW